MMKVEIKTLKDSIVRTQIDEGESPYGISIHTTSWEFKNKKDATAALLDLKKQVEDLNKQKKDIENIIERTKHFDTKFVEKLAANLEILNKLVSDNKSKKRQVELIQEVIPFLKLYREKSSALYQYNRVIGLIPVAQKDVADMEKAIEKVFK